MNPILEDLAQTGGGLPIWFRDDDAGPLHEGLVRLGALLAPHPVWLGVIPAAITPELVAWVGEQQHIRVGQHGWAHTNHASAGCGKAEFGAHRTLEAMEQELSRGGALMAEAFGFAPEVFIPPWNRLTESLMDSLEGLGFRGVSLHGSRLGRQRMGARAGWVCCDVRLDVMACEDAEAELTQLMVDNGHREPIGILTHHRVMEDFGFLERLVDGVRVGVFTVVDPFEALRGRGA